MTHLLFARPPRSKAKPHIYDETHRELRAAVADDDSDKRGRKARDHETFKSTGDR